MDAKLWLAQYATPTETTTLGVFSTKELAQTACSNFVAEGDFWLDETDLYWQETDPDYFIVESDESLCVVCAVVVDEVVAL